MSTLIAVASDTHINSTVALCPPRVNLDDGGTYNSTPAQRWLWSSWLESWRKVGNIPADRKVLILDGDVGELDTKRRSNQLVTPNEATVLSMIGEVLEPALSVVQDVYIVRGTQAHVGKSSWLEEAVAADIDGVKRDEKRGTASWWHIQGMIEGIRVDIAHHASMGGQPWSKYSAVTNSAARMTWQYAIEKGIQPPDLAIRAHNHQKGDSGDNLPVRMIYLPCWSLITEYGYRTGRENSRPDIGMLLVMIDGDRFEPEFLIYRPTSERRVWSVSL